MRLFGRICIMFSTIICVCILSTQTISYVGAAPGARSQEGRGESRESQPAFTNYPQFPISPYFGSFEDFALFRDDNADNHRGKRQLQAVPSNKQDTKRIENNNANLANEPKQQAIVLNSKTPPDTASSPVAEDRLVSDTGFPNDIGNNHNNIDSDVNGTTYNDIWANVPLANVNGFIMPIVPPVLLLPRPKEGTPPPGIDHTGADPSGMGLSGLDLTKPDPSEKDSSMPDSSGANLLRKESSGTELSGRELYEIQPAGKKLSWSKSSRTPSLNRMARSVSSDADPLPVMCGEFNLVPGSSLYLASPYYPSNYPDNFSCRWSIKAVAGEKVAVRCRSFVLASGDYLAVGVEGDPTSLVRYTAARALSLAVLPSNEVFVSFFSDGSQQSKGFSCTAYSMGVEDDVNSQPTPSIESVLQSSGLSHPDCGLVNRPLGRIVKGQPADRNEYPWQVYLRIRWDAGGVSGCGGSLISQRWVLTAAHCVLPAMTSGSIGGSLVPPPKVSVLVGAHDINNVSASGAVIESSRVIVHPKNSFSYDLALIELSKNVSFSSQVRPVCLPTLSMQERNLTGVPMAVIGWGNTETGAQPEALRELGQQGLEWSSCKRVYGDYITEHHFCTTSTKGGHICLGDSGGPTMIAEGGRYYIRGVISFVASKECNLDFPDGHTSVTHFLTWIKTVSGVAV